MSSPDYYRRQAVSSLNLANTATNPQTKRKLLELANSYMMRADAAAHAQLDAFIAKSNFGASYLA